jgi:phosphoserine/homoserine phosphotransferase
LEIVCLDLEGVLIPEIWVEVAERTGIDALKATTRDIADYDVLMRHRLDLMAEHNLGIDEISAAVATMRPLDGAEAFLEGLRERFQVVILSDTFYDITKPLMRQLGWPTLLCHALQIDGGGALVDYRLRLDDHKRRAVKAFHMLNFRVLASGDSYNDIGMLREADAGIFFRAPPNVEREYPEFPVVRDYDMLLGAFAEASARLGAPAPRKGSTK